MKFNDLNSVKERIIDKEIYSILNQDIEDVFKYFERELKISLKRTTKWNEFKERFYRRNVIIHKAGVIDKIYRKKTGFDGIDKQLDVPEEYLTESIKLFDKFGNNLFIAVDKKFKK